MIKVYNTLTNKKEPFKTIEEGKVTMYVCGPTVYNYIHIGNARSAVAFDTIRKYLEYRGYQVKYVSNFTDVDDKIIKAAQDMNLEPSQVTSQFIDAFFEDTEALNVRRADAHPTVTENIDNIIDFNQVLIDKGYAYESEGDVYYRTRKFKDYGKLSGISVDQLASGASNRLDEADRDKKEDPLDFALWKQAKPGEIYWDSPWGQGRPGWHIECSVMASQELGDTIDIHAGGQDLQFPHHENEIAQSEGKSGQAFANYWLHNGFVTMNDEKMSKSLGNFKLVHDLRKIHNPQTLRFFLASAHYRRPINYSEEAIHEAKQNLNRIKTALANARHRLQTAQGTLQEDQEDITAWQNLKDSFIQDMDDDFQAQNGIADLYEMIASLNRYIARDQVSKQVIDLYLEDLKAILYIFGVEDVEAEEDLLDGEIEALIEERQQARADRNFDRADEIRDDLRDRGIILEDTPHGVRWKRESRDEE
ncbi:Cysteine--tRNA ligase [Alloiococcus otitis]|uniref:Cysteine--tRNA ligase n=1 Tax=Alloiococcus otitis ATCC 51267 TaxID=883081 RepID=K9EPW7_9LACT|nr:cysteine--tRNA ligase [Alloiococcus otitis]EKU92932.1 cysteine-tRNA ligase [Alloiococcus otitis ATCC 51267]SUU80443.1 Cysteine--tRNA ligase [Alloiococcus otitis]